MIKMLFLSYLSGALGAFFMLRFAKGMNLVDMPTSRSSHRLPTPRAGGLGIGVVFLCGSVVILKAYGLAAAAGVLGLFSLAADRFHIPPKIRLSVHLAVSFTVLFSFFGSPQNFYAYFPYVFFIIFIAGTANYYNFMDGIDGMAALMGMVSFGLMGYYAFFVACDPVMGRLALVVAFACIGFLPFNFPRAKIFMGDVGSILLGFIFAYFVVVFSVNFLDFEILVSFLFMFYADEWITMYIRLKDGENLTRPHRRHFYQILVNQYKIPHWKVSLGYAVTQFVIGASILALRPFGAVIIFLLLSIYFALFILLNMRVRRSLRASVSKAELNC